MFFSFSLSLSLKVMLFEGMTKSRIKIRPLSVPLTLTTTVVLHSARLLIKLLRAAVRTRTTLDGGLTSVARPIWMAHHWTKTCPPSHISTGTPGPKMAHLSKSNQWLWRSGELRSRIPNKSIKILKIMELNIFGSLRTCTSAMWTF